MNDKIMISLSYDELQKLIMDAVARMPPMAMPPEIAEIEALKRAKSLTTRHVAKLFGLSVEYLEKRRSGGKGPRYFKDGKKVLYRMKDVEDYLSANMKKTIDQQ